MIAFCSDSNSTLMRRDAFFRTTAKAMRLLISDSVKIHGSEKIY